MKVRTNFVTNSSSSCYVVAIKEGAGQSCVLNALFNRRRIEENLESLISYEMCSNGHAFYYYPKTSNLIDELGVWGKNRAELTNTQVDQIVDSLVDEMYGIVMSNKVFNIDKWSVYQGDISDYGWGSCVDLLHVAMRSHVEIPCLKANRCRVE